MRSIDLHAARASALRAVEEASGAILRAKAGGVSVRAKADQSPVTSADLAAEEAILAVLRADWPGASFLCEESGAAQGDPRLVWIVDPLDGTRGFARGGSHYGPLVALELDGVVVAGAMALPAFGRVYGAAHGLGCTRDGARLALRPPPAAWDAAVLSCGELSRLLRTPQAGGVADLVRSCAAARGYGDVAALAMLLDGAADLWLEAGVQPWDLAPAMVLVAEAGGVCTDFDGAASIRSGDAVAGSPELHAHALQRLALRGR